MIIPKTDQDKIEYGFCKCGCGLKTNIATENHPGRGVIKGQPAKFIRGHSLNSLTRTGKDAPRWNGGKTIDNNGYVRVYDPDSLSSNSRGYILEHILVAETVMGKRLPPHVIVHHSDEKRANNKKENLVICQNRAYHKLLHQRLNAFKACGNANWRKCWICKKYDDPKNLYISKNNASPVHNSCRVIYKQLKKEKNHDRQ